MIDEILEEVKRISNGKKTKNVLTLLYVYLIRILISIIPIVVLGIINFIITTILTLIGINFIKETYNLIYDLIVSLVTFITYLLTSPFMFGCLNYFYSEAKEEKEMPKITIYIKNAKLVFKQMYMFLRLILFTCIGLVFFIVPGVIYLSKRIMAPFILIDNENISVSDAIAESKDIMKNRYKELIVVFLKILVPSLIMYILSNYIAHFNMTTYVLGSLLLLVTLVMFLVALSDSILGIAIMYTKVKGKKKGAIDVEYREIKD